MYNRYRVVPGVKRPGREVYHPRPSSVQVREKVELYLYSPLCAFIACYRKKSTFYEGE